MGWDMIDENAWQEMQQCHSHAVNNGQSDETWFMRQADKEIKQCHLHPVQVGHGMRHDETQTAWQRKYVVQLLTLYYIGYVWVRWLGNMCNDITSCFPCKVRVPGETKCTVSYILTYPESYYQSLISVTHFLLVMEWDNSASIGAIWSRTACWPQYEMCMRLWCTSNCIITHSLFSKSPFHHLAKKW